jgi:hypothetical protein
MLWSMEEQKLHFSEERPLTGWRLLRVRRSECHLVLSAPLIHNPGFERFPSRTIEAICYQAEQQAPAPGCRCGLYAAIEGRLDSLSGYLSDSAHDHDPPIYAESRVPAVYSSIRVASAPSGSRSYGPRRRPCCGAIAASRPKPSRN